MLLKLSLAVPVKNCYLVTINGQCPYSPHVKMGLIILVDRLWANKNITGCGEQLTFTTNQGTAIFCSVCHNSAQLVIWNIQMLYWRCRWSVLPLSGHVNIQNSLWRSM